MTSPAVPGGEQREELPAHGLLVMAGGRRYWGGCICGWSSPEYAGQYGPMPVQLAFGRHLLAATRPPVLPVEGTHTEEETQRG